MSTRNQVQHNTQHHVRFTAVSALTGVSSSCIACTACFSWRGAILPAAILQLPEIRLHLIARFLQLLAMLAEAESHQMLRGIWAVVESADLLAVRGGTRPPSAQCPSSQIEALPSHGGLSLVT